MRLLRLRHRKEAERNVGESLVRAGDGEKADEVVDVGVFRGKNGAEEGARRKVAVVAFAEQEAVRSSVAVGQRRVGGNEAEREQDGYGREIVDVLVEVGLGAQGMAEVGATELAGFLPLHGRDEHPVVVHERERAVVKHEDTVRLQVAVGERLRQKPHGKAAEVVGKHLEGARVAEVLADVVVERGAVDPVHEQHGKLVVGRAGGVDKQLAVVIPHLREVSRLHKLQFFGYLPVGLPASFLFADETLHGVELACARVFHLENHGEVPARHHGIAVVVDHGAQVAQLVEVVLRRTDGVNVF